MHWTTPGAASPPSSFDNRIRTRLMIGNSVAKMVGRATPNRVICVRLRPRHATDDAGLPVSGQ